MRSKTILSVIAAASAGIFLLAAPAVAANTDIIADIEKAIDSLTESDKDLKKQLKKMEKRIDALEKENDKQQKQIAKLKKFRGEIKADAEYENMIDYLGTYQQIKDIELHDYAALVLADDKNLEQFERFITIDRSGHALYADFVDYLKPGAPAGLLTVPGDTYVKLSWTAPDDRGSPITDYIVEYRMVDGGTWETFDDGTSTDTFANVTGLTKHVPYLFRVAATNGEGTGEYSEIVRMHPGLGTPDIVGTSTILSTTIGNSTSLSTIPFTVKFNGPVTDFETTDISTTSGTVQNLNTTHAISPFGKVWHTDGLFHDNLEGMAFNSTGYLYVADSNYDGTSSGVADPSKRIQIFDPSGNFVGKFGSVGGGDGQFAGDLAIAINATGYVYVVDRGFDVFAGNFGAPKVQIFDPSGNFVGKFGSLGNGLDDLKQPSGIAINATGYVHVVGYSPAKLAVFDPSGNFVYGYDTFVDINHAKKIGWSVAGIAINSTGYIYLLDKNAHDVNNRKHIHVLGPSGDFVKRFANPGDGDDKLSRPSGIAINSTGYVYVADTRNDRIQVFDPTGNSVSSFTDGVYNPRHIAIDPDGSVYVTNASSIVQVTDNAYSFDVVNPTRGMLTVSIPADSVTYSGGDGNTASNTISVNVTQGPTAAPPGAPTGFAATSGDGHVVLEWIAPTDDGDSPITGYDIQYKPSGTSAWQNAPLTTATNATITNLTNDNSYDFRVAATNAQGTGSYSTITATPTAS